MCEYVIDADVIIAFSKVDKIDLLFKLYTGNFLLFQTVKNEIKNDYKKIQKYKIKEVELNPLKYPDETVEFSKIKRNYQIGNGESVLMAYCKFRTERVILLSNNYKDIVRYCEQNNIKYYTLIDILIQLHKQKIINKEEAGGIYDFWIQKGIKLPEASFNDLLKKYNSQYKKN